MMVFNKTDDLRDIQCYKCSIEITLRTHEHPLKNISFILDADDPKLLDNIKKIIETSRTALETHKVIEDE